MGNASFKASVSTLDRNPASTSASLCMLLIDDLDSRKIYGTCTKLHTMASDVMYGPPLLS